MFQVTTVTPEETKALGFKLGKAVEAGDIICLKGDLGAGKTLFRKVISASEGRI